MKLLNRLTFVLAQYRAGANPPLGSDPFSSLGIRNVDGSFNNLLHLVGYVDQYGYTINTDSLGIANQPFIYLTPKSFDNGAAADDQVLPGFPPNMILRQFAGRTWTPVARSHNLVGTSPRPRGSPATPVRRQSRHASIRCSRSSAVRRYASIHQKRRRADRLPIAPTDRTGIDRRAEMRFVPAPASTATGIKFHGAFCLPAADLWLGPGNALFPDGI